MKIHSSIKTAVAMAALIMAVIAMPSSSRGDSGLSEEDVNKAAMDFVKEMAGPLLDFLGGEVTPQAIQDLQETKGKVDNFMNLVDKAARGNLTNADMLKEAYGQIQGAGAKFLPSTDLLDKLVKTIRIGQEMKRMADALEADNEALNVLDTFKGAYPAIHDGIPGVRTDSAAAKNAYHDYVSRGGLDNKYSRYMKRKFGFSTLYFKNGKWPSTPDDNTIYSIQSMLKDADTLYTSINAKIRARVEAGKLKTAFKRWLALTPGDFNSALEALQRAKEELKYKKKIPEYEEMLTMVDGRLSEAKLLLDSETPYQALEKCNSLAGELRMAKIALGMYAVQGNETLINQLDSSYDDVREECGSIENELDRRDVAGGKGCFDGQEPVYMAQEDGTEKMVGCMPPCQEGQVLADFSGTEVCVTETAAKGIEEENQKEASSDWDDPNNECRRQKCPEGQQAGCALEEVNGKDVARFTGCEDIPDPMDESPEEGSKEIEEWEKEWEENYKNYHAELDAIAKEKKDEWESSFGEFKFSNEWRQMGWGEAIIMNDALRRNLNNIYQVMMTLKHNVDLNRENMLKAKEKVDALMKNRGEIERCEVPYTGSYEITMSVSGAMSFIGKNDLITMFRRENLMEIKNTLMAKRKEFASVKSGAAFGELGKYVNQYKRFAKEYIRVFEKYGSKINIINENLDAIVSASQHQIAIGYKFPQIEPLELEDLNFANEEVESCARSITILDEKLKEVEDFIKQIDKDEATLNRILGPIFARVDKLKNMSGSLRSKSWSELKIIAREVGYVTSSSDEVYLKNRIKKIGPLIRSNLESSSGLLLPAKMFFKIREAVENDIGEAYRAVFESLPAAMAGVLEKELKKLVSKIRSAGSKAKIDSISNQVNVILKKTAETALEDRLTWRFSDVLKELQGAKLDRLGALNGVDMPSDINNFEAYNSVAANYLAMVLFNCRSLTPGRRYSINEAKTCMSKANSYMKRYNGYNDPEALALYSALSSGMSWITGEALPALPVSKTQGPPGGKSGDGKSVTPTPGKVAEDVPKAAEEVKKKAEEEAELKAAEEARQKAEEEANRKAEEAKRLAEEKAREEAEEAKRLAEEKAREEAEEAKQLAEEEAKERAEEAKLQALEIVKEKLEDVTEDAVMDLEEIKSSLSTLTPDPDSAGVEAEELAEQAHAIIKEVKIDLAKIYGDVSDAPPPDERLMAALAEIKKIVEKMESESGAVVIGESSQARMEEIRNFYQSFADAYSGKDLGALTAKLSENWTSATGSDLADLEDILDNSFSIFDRIEYGVSGLNVKAIEKGQFEVKYQSKIIGYISDQGIHHTETTEITEILGYEDGEIRILKTTSGQFWQE